MSYTASYIVNSSSAQGTTDFTFTFPYIKEAHIEVFLNYSKITQGSGNAQYQVITNVSPKLIRLNTGITSANLRVEIRRNSSLETPLVDYADGSTLTANDLDTSALQSLYIDQELKDNQGKTVSVDEATGLPSMGESSAGNLRLTKVADPTAAQDAATKNYVDTKVFTSAQIQDGTITSADIANGAIVDADVNASAAISGSKLQASTGSNAGSMSAADKTKLDGIDIGAKDDQTAAEIRVLVESATDSNVFTDADHSKLNAIEAGATTDQTISEIKALIAGSPLGSTHLAESYFTETESDARYFKQDSSETITSGVAWSGSDSYIATTGAIDARITDLVDDVGGFVPIVNETSFPNANPDVNNGAGTLVSIKALSSNLTSNGSGVATIANGTVGNSTVTITGLANSTTYAANFGMIVETTTTLNTYTFHRQVPIATEVSTVAGSITNVNTVATNLTSINDFADKYRIASSAPSSNNDDGDLYYNTTDNKLYVYNGSAWEVAASLNGSGGTVTGDTTFTDNTKLKLGTGGDLQIYHDGSNSVIKDAGTGLLAILSSQLNITDSSGAEDCIKVIENGAVNLYYDNVKKLETTSAGIEVAGKIGFTGSETYQIALSDNQKIRFGGGNDLKIFHDGTNSVITNATGDLYINNNADTIIKPANDCFIKPQDGEDGIKVIGNGAVELYYDNSKKFETLSTGAKVTGNLGISDWTFVQTSNNYITLQSGNGSSAGLILRTSDGTQRAVFYANINNEAGILNSSGSWSFKTDNSGNCTATSSFAGNDNVKLKLGTGDDLQIYHDGTNSIIEDVNDNPLWIQTDGAIRLTKDAAAEYYATFNPDGAVELYYDGVLKALTYGDGLRVNGDFWIDNQTNSGKDVWFDESANTFKFSDDVQATFGTGNDLKIYHEADGHSYIKSSTATNSYLNIDSTKLRIRNAAGDEESAIFTQNGAVELYYDDSKKLETTSYGNLSAGQVRVSSSNASTVAFSAGDAGTGFYNSGSNSIGYSANGTQKWNINSAGDLRLVDNVKANFGTSDDLQIYHDATHSWVQNATGNLYLGNASGNANHIHIQAKYGDEGIIVYDDAQVELYYDGSKQVQTFSSGLNWQDNKKAEFGNSGDLKIYHDGSNSYIRDEGTGYLLLDTNGAALLLRTTSGEVMIGCYPNAAAELLYDNVKKFETTSAGAKVTGELETTGNIQIGRLPENNLGREGVFFGVGGNYSTAVDKKYLIGFGYNSDFSSNDYPAVIGFQESSNSGNTKGDLIFATRDSTGGTDAPIERLKIQSNGNATFAGSVYVPDGEIVGWGDTGTPDMRIYHVGGGNSYINNRANNLYIQSTNAVEIGSTDTNGSVQETSAKFVRNGACNLYYDDSTDPKLETTSTGAKVTGTSLNVSTGSSSGGLFAQANGCEAYVWAIQNAGNLMNGSTAGRMGLRSAGFDFSADSGTSTQVTIDGSGNLDVNSGTVSDSKGNLREIPQSSKSANYVVVSGDNGKHIINSSGGWTINTSTNFTAGMVVTFINNSNSAQTIFKASGVTIYNSADGVSGDHVLAARGMATAICTANDVYYISGAGLS